MSMLNKDYPRLTREALTAAVAKDLKVDPSDVKVEKLEITGGSAEGEGYQCILKMIAVSYKLKDSSTGVGNYVAKFMSMNPERVKRMRESATFDTEAAMYLGILPELTKLDPEIGLPKIMYGSGEEILLIMENLKLSGFHLPDMVKGMDKIHAEKALEWLARLHAASYHFMTTYEGGLAKFKQNYQTLVHDDWVRQRDIFTNMIMKTILGSTDNAFKAIIAEHMMERRPDLVKRVKEFKEKKAKDLVALHNNPGVFSAIIHNDAWTNNFMFRRNESGKMEMTAIDFQLCRRARPTIDVAYLLWTSTTPQMRRLYEESLLNHYYETLTSRLNLYGYKPDLYPREAFDRDYKDCCLFGYQISQMHTMLHLTPKDATEGKLDLEAISPNSKEEAMQYFAEFVRGQIALSRKNAFMRERLIALAEDAAQKGII